MKNLTKIRNMILISIILFLTILGIHTTSSAIYDEEKAKQTTYKNSVAGVDVGNVKQGETFYYSFNEYKANPNKLLCLEHGEKLSSHRYWTYKCVNRIEISGDVASGYINGQFREATSPANGWNARLAAAIAYTNRDS